MLKNYFTIAIRNLRRHKGYTIINVTGLAVGLTCCLLIAVYVQHEFSYDTFHSQADRVYRVVSDYGAAGSRDQSALTAGPVAPLLEAEFAEVEHATRLLSWSVTLEHEGKMVEEDNVFLADSTVFNLFDFTFLQGTPQTALAKPFSVVLSEALALKYFGETDVVGQTVGVDGFTVTVTGVLAPVPSNSHLQFDALVSMTTCEQNDGCSWLFDNWFSNAFYVYLRMPEQHDAQALEAKLPAFIKRHANPQMLEQNPVFALTLEPLKTIYLHSDRSNQAGPTGDRTYLYLLILVGGFILLIACINFTNLATARSADRAREVGVRKVVGAYRGQIAVQFLGESILLTVMALVTAVALTQFLLPTFSTFTGTPLHLGQPGFFILGLLGLTLGVGLVAGAYPAFALSSFKPAHVLKGTFRASSRGRILRKGLVVVQFGISIALIVATLVVFAQLDHLRNQDLGFNKEHVLVVDFAGDSEVVTQYETIKAELTAHPAVMQVAASFDTPTGEGIGGWNIEIENTERQMQSATLPHYPVDYDFIDLYEMEMVAGRSFSRDFADGTASLIINEAAVNRFGFASAEEALGKRFETWPSGGEIVGVVSDFNFRSLHQPIGPLTMRVLPDKFTTFSVRLQADEATLLRTTVADLEALWNTMVPHRPFQYTFLDDSFDAQYRAEERFGQIFGLFAALAVIIACLGLFGLAAFTAQQRTKEIGLRKVMGATISQIVVLLSKEFALLIIAAFAITTPFIYVAMNQWLDGFAYRVDIAWWIFLVAGVAALGIAWLTVSYQSIRAASANPVDALRYE